MTRLIWLLVIAVLLVAPSTAAAETFNVIATADVVEPCTGTVCPSIRAALAAAKDSAGADTIAVPGGDYPLSEGVLAVDSPVTVRGAGARLTTIFADAARQDRVFDVSSGVTAQFTGLTMRGGTAWSANGFFGGNLRNNGGDVLLDHVRVTDGSAESGGGISNAAGTMTIQYSLIDNNRALSGGGDSGGIQNFGSGQTPGVLTVRDSTVAFNAARLGGGIFSWGNPDNVTTLQRVTVAQNVGGDRGIGGVGSGAVGEPFHVSGSIIANNTVNGEPSNCGNPGPFSDGGNVVSNGDCEFTADGDVQDEDPLLSVELEDAGGETDLLTIASDSPARDRAGACDGTDQRDLERPQGAGCDAGAFEIEAVAQVNTKVESPPTDTGGGGTVTQPPQEEQLPPPEPNETVNLEPKSGTVKVRVKGTNRFVELTEGMQVPLGSELDLRSGRITLTAASDKSGGTATADFYGGIALVRQTKGAKPITRLTLTEKLACPNAGRANASARRKKKRRLWGDGSGSFRTEGSYSSATVRGTKWLVEDQCKSTLTRVVRGSVSVRDFAKKKTVVVKAGKQYVARRKG